MDSDEAIKYPGQHDFLLGRGGETNNHSGNILFRQLIKDFKEAYQNAPKTQKPMISQKLVAKWRSMSPPGRFLERNEQEKVWRDVGDAVACRKTSKALGERGKRSKQGHLDTDDDDEGHDDPGMMGATSTNKRKKMDGLYDSSGTGMRLPPSIRANKEAPRPSQVPSTILVGPSASLAPITSTAAAASSFLQGLGVDAPTNSVAAAAAARAGAGASNGASANAGQLAALLEQHQKQQQQQPNSIAALLELQRRQQQQQQTQQQQQQQQPTMDLAALLGQATTAAPPAAGTSATPNTDLATWLADQQAKQDLTALLLGQQTTGARSTTSINNNNMVDIATLLMGQQQKHAPMDLAALLSQTAAAPSTSAPIGDLAAYLGQQKQQQQASDLSPLLQQQQQHQQQQQQQQNHQAQQSSLAALLEQQQHLQRPEIMTLLEQHNRPQQAQSALALLLDQQQQQQQQQQQSSLSALLDQQQQKQQLQNSLASLLDQQQHQLDFASLLGQPGTQPQPKVTSEQLQSTIAAVVEQQKKTQDLQACLAAVLGNQPTPQHLQLAALLQQQATPSSSATASLATGIGGGEGVNSILSATSFSQNASQPRSQSLLAAGSNSSSTFDSKPAAVAGNSYLTDFLAALGGGQQGSNALAASHLAASSVSATARLQSLLEASHETPSSVAAAQGVQMEADHLVQGKHNEAGSNSALGLPQQPQQQRPTSDGDLWQLLAGKVRDQQAEAATALPDAGNQRATAALAAALRQMESNIVQQYQRMASNNGNGQGQL